MRQLQRDEKNENNDHCCEEYCRTLALLWWVSDSALRPKGGARRNHERIRAALDLFAFRQHVQLKLASNGAVVEHPSVSVSVSET